MDEYQKRLIDPATAEEIRGKILDNRSQNTSAYDPDGLESPETLVLSSVPLVHRLPRIQARNVSYINSGSFRHGYFADDHY